MSGYIYETHLHTSQGSRCGRITGADAADLYKSRGYSGIIVTDHFFGGNTTVPTYLPWDERIDLFCVGYEDAKAEGKRIGLDVYLGVEAGFDATDFLLYGIDKTWLKAHPDMMSWGIHKQYEMVSAAGGIVVHAHPFRKDFYIPEVRLYPEYIDAVEAINIGNRMRNADADTLARAYAIKHGLPMTGGGDVHSKDDPAGGMIFDTPLRSVRDFVERVKSGVGYQLVK